MAVQDSKSASADAVDTVFAIVRDELSGTWADLARRVPERIKGWSVVVNDTGEYRVPTLTDIPGRDRNRSP